MKNSCFGPNLRLRVLREAGATAKSLTPAAAALVDGHVAAWASRAAPLSDAAVAAAATELRSRFPECSVEAPASPARAALTPPPLSRPVGGSTTLGRGLPVSVARTTRAGGSGGNPAAGSSRRAPPPLGSSGRPPVQAARPPRPAAVASASVAGFKLSAPADPAAADFYAHAGDPPRKAGAAKPKPAAADAGASPSRLAACVSALSDAELRRELLNGGRALEPAQRENSSTGAGCGCGVLAPRQAGSRGSATEAAPEARGAAAAGSPGRQQYRRPEVLRRMQRVATDQEWVAAIDAEQAALDAEARDARVRKAAVRDQMRRDMSAAVRFQDARRQEEAAERERLAAQVVTAMNEVKADEVARRDATRQKRQAEITAIEQQAAIRRAVGAEARAKERASDVAYQKAVRVALDRETREAAERKAELKVSMRRFLGEAKAIQDARIDSQRADRAAKAARTAREAVELEADRREREAATERKRMARVTRQQQLQTAVAERYESVRDAERAKVAAEAAAARRHLERNVAALAAREAEDKAKARALRQQMVKSLDVEIAIHGARKAQEDEEKRGLRAVADEQAARDDAVRRAEEADKQVSRRRLREALAAQLDDRYDTLMAPLEIKIGGRASASPAASVPRHR